MKKFIQGLLPFEIYTLKTRLTKSEIQNKISSRIGKDDYDYRSGITQEGFYVYERFIKSFGIGHVHNSFAPMATARIKEEDGYSTIRITVRMSWISLILFLFMYTLFFIAGALAIPVAIVALIAGAQEAAYIASTALALLVPFLFMYFMMHFFYKRPAKRLKELLEELLVF